MSTSATSAQEIEPLNRRWMESYVTHDTAFLE
jgi:hypothetical protein